MVASESSLSSRVSLISLDPAVASHITGTTRTTTVPSASAYGSSPGKSTKTPDTEVSRRHVRNISAPSTSEKKGPIPLRRVKDSTEVLRQRSTKSSNRRTKQSVESVQDNVHGRNFTVGNVGTGGVLYLTPSTHQKVGASPHSVASPVHLPSTAPALLANTEQRIAPKEKSSTNRSVSSSQSTTSKRSARPHRRPVVIANHGRSQSFSTVEEHRESLLGPQSRTVRIVINRPETARPRSSQDLPEPAQELLPALEVPIPHYRIGTFRLSSNGTPMLRGSSYTRASATPSDVTPTTAIMQAEGYFSGPPPASLKALKRLEPREVAGMDSDMLRPPIPPLLKAASAESSSFPNVVQPEVFDGLNQVYDDPSVVRYCQNVREITAATPARIIAQISSDSFMDYELVSDFFLTFRAYMSTYQVLDLLLARLRWAIGRLEDDGRIIRVRTFAALRHWILNYFMDDFFLDGRLRARFCKEVNKLYTDVKTSEQHGFSDLKLLRDLKRCWNGRCSLCWDPEDFDLDGEQEEDIHPGGETEDDRTPKPPENMPSDARSESPQTPMLRGPTHSWFEADPTLRPMHERQESYNSALMSDGSLQASSCFVPKYILRPGADGDAVRSKARHPVSVQLRRKNAPANLQVVTQPAQSSKPLGHKKGASSIDSNREPTPRKTQPEPPEIVIEEGSIIRGLLYSPSAPFVQIVSSQSTQSLDRNDTLRAGPRKEQVGTQSATQPPGRNIFGSLRKVLGNKHGQLDVTMFTVSQSTQDVPNRGQTAQLPLNMSKSHDELRNKTVAGMPRKGEMRIDLLSAAVCQNYETQFPSKHRITYGPLFATNPALQPSTLAGNNLEPPRAPSHATGQSGSILIVDDTRPDLPSMSGGLAATERDLDYIPAPLLIVSHGDGAEDRKESFDAVATQRSSNVLPHNLDMPTTQGSSDTLERVMADLADPTRTSEDNEIASLSGVGRTLSRTTASSKTMKEDPKPVGDNPAVAEQSVEGSQKETEDSEGDDSESEMKLPTQTLRRRPGGDLRRVENVQELDHTFHHMSVDTASAVSDSPHESLLIMRTETAQRVPPVEATPPKKAISMINTHSSQALRPSFEAAVAGFSAIPDDDDGGLEATLMKLEGRYEKKSPPMEQHPLDASSRRRSLPELSRMSGAELQRPPVKLASPIADSFVRVRATVDEVASENSNDEPLTPSPVVAEIKPTASRRSSIYGLATESVADSEESYGSLPLLKREAGHESAAVVPSQKAHTDLPLVAPGYFPQDPPQLFHLPKGPPPSGNKHRNSIPRPDTANDSARSFLLDEDENLSDLSSEISVDIINYSEVVGRSISPMLAAPGTAISGLEIPAHPLTYASVVNLRIPTPPERASEPIPPIPKPKPTNTTQQTPKQDYTSTQPLGRLPAGPAHMPFILACDSQILAQQMTLVEKSALCEVEWSDLVEMRWDSKNAEVVDWVECLSQPNIRGIDLVSTRFNLVMKWAQSEIVLTQDIQERARVITKYIHVAAHARRLHNYATMLQITLALTSTDCTRLSKTWALVSDPDKSLLKHMETLAQPLRNFHDLRAEMESADFSDGCIPFLGLYIRDLTYNAQKPSHLPGAPGTESLINFERYRSTAVIVKGILRLIDASSRYTFEPVQGVIERCLWMATLADDRIRSASKALEE
ncbi:Guanine nucleotide exchange factor lte1 [Cladophialophora chaetospira]|uniref:Guanine nucleotide exchange factor lte1 n=1 Tax=Cladophialophora chaetospira TaxID=386627 RepID=A0AA39CK38_9EURO|nr:Guanine nucleotide exchange factor lte1 [Cladophialophora chaetospira]